MQIFNIEREYPRMFSEVSEVSYVVACIYKQKNRMKEDIRRKVTNKLFFSLHFFARAGFNRFVECFVLSSWLVYFQMVGCESPLQCDQKSFLFETNARNCLYIRLNTSS